MVEGFEALVLNLDSFLCVAQKQLFFGSWVPKALSIEAFSSLPKNGMVFALVGREDIWPLR